MSKNKIERSNLFEMLKERGYVYQATNEERVKEILNGDPITVYLGIDPTADSLHIGHFFSLMMVKYFQDAGHRIIVLIGAATALVGDPSGRTDMRNMISKDKVNKNLKEVKNIVEKFVDMDGENPAIIVNNADWFKGYDYIDFMRDIGAFFNVNRMLSSDSYAKRLEEGGLTFLEMGYMLMQAYDFLYLHDKYNCVLQIGGSDQWGNMVAGTELARRKGAKDNKQYNLEAFTCPLLTNSEGEKMGKTARGALWVARDKTSVYDFYQYFYNVPDKDVLQLLKLFTRKPLIEIEEIISKDIINAKKIMAFEITKLVHGEKDAVEAQEASKALFSGVGTLENAPTYIVSKQEFEAGLSIIDIAVAAGIIKSKSEGRRLIEQNGLLLNDSKINSFDQQIEKEDIKNGYALLKKGKKSFIKLIIE